MHRRRHNPTAPRLAAALVFAWVGWVSAAPPAPAPTPTAAATPGPAPTPDRPGQSRARVQSAMGELGAIVDEARRDQDIARLNCALGYQDRGQQAVELSQEETGVAGNRNEADSSRILAAAKLEALADRLELLVESSQRDCGPVRDADAVDVTQTDAEEANPLQEQDPSAVAITPPALPPVLDPQWLPTTSGIQ